MLATVNLPISMGFVLSIIFFITLYLTPTTLFGSLAQFRIELIIAVLILFVSLPALMKSFILKTPQLLALIGLAMAVFLSVFIGRHWLGGAVPAFFDFFPTIFVYFIVCLHFNSKKRLQVLVFMMLFACLFIIAHGAADLFHGVPKSGPPISADTGEVSSYQWNLQHPYLFPMANSKGELIYRLRGLGEINDPNDFGQLLICTIPLMFIFWRPKRGLGNFVFVILPVCVLMYGTFLTHSRGALLGLVAVAVVAARRRIGTLPSLLLAGGLFVGLMALNFTGGRDISADSGVDRTALWGESLQLFKSHPLFGVGVGRTAELTDSHHTSHNSVAVCAAELGFFGLYFWSLFLFPTVRDALVIASPLKVNAGNPAIIEEAPSLLAMRKPETLDQAQVNQLGRLLLLSLTGFLVTAWFLSRTFAVTFFLLGGMVEAVFEMALQRGMIAPRMRLLRVLLYSGVLAVSLVLILYVMLRILNLAH